VRRLYAPTLVALAWATMVLPARADSVNLSGNVAASTSGLGDFTGTLTYTDTNASSATLTIQLTNTSPLANGGYITGFVFNNPSDAITGINFSSTNPNFDLLSGPFNVNGTSGVPFGQFDIGTSTGGSFEGPGNPTGGIAVGNSATFTFDLTGTGLDALDAMSFVDTLSTGTGSGGGDYQFMVVRFTGFNNGGSDKVPANGTPGGPAPGPTPGPTVPGPASWLLGCVGFGLVYLPTRLRRRITPAV